MGSKSSARVRGTLLGWALLCFAIAPAGAVHAPQTPSLDVHGLAADALAAADAEAARDALHASEAWRTWSQQHPAWRVHWNLRTRTAHRLYGAGLQAGRPIVDARSAEQASRDLLVAQAGLTGVEAGELRLAAADRRLGRWYVIFEQVEAGIPVRGARADVRITDAGQVQLFGADWHREPRVDRVARVSETAALATAARELGTATDVAHELVIVPEPSGTGHTYRLAREIRFRTAEPRGVWLAWVDAQSGELLKRENQIRYAQLTGQITASIEPEIPGDAFESRPLRDTRLSVLPGSTEFGFTDADGNFDVTTTSSDSVDVRVRLQGRFGRIFNAADGFATPTIDARMLPGTPRNFHWDDAQASPQERDAYFNTVRSHQIITALDPAFDGLDYVMPITVDIFDRDCNAFYDGLGINFFGESMRCVNTARIANVVYHEYGHGITDQIYRPFSPSGAMHEGFSDYFACTIENQPLVGRGFRGPGTFLRTIDNTNRFPEDAIGEVHRDGLIIAGALWDLREAIGAPGADSLFHYARYGRADNFDDYMLDVLLTDDTNGNIFDGTPRFDAIIAAFSAHGIGEYTVEIAHEPEPDTEDPNKPLAIEATILSIFALDPPSVQLHYAVNGGSWNALPMTPTGNAVREYVATIPQQPAETNIAYYITASDTAGTTAQAPPGGAAAPFEFRVGADTTSPTIIHTQLPDQPVDAPAGWFVSASVTDNLDRGLASVRLNYGRNTASPTDSLDFTPVDGDRFRATIPSTGAVIGDAVVYHVSATDSAQTPNLAHVPGIGSYTFDVVPGLFRDLQASDGGLVQSGDWEWGEPIGEPQAFTDSNVWGTGIQGSYNNDLESTLDLGAIDLTTWTAGALVFQHWMNCEDFFDGGQVQVSPDGFTWTTIEPNGGYPSVFVLSLGGPGYSGNLGGWQQAEFELSQWVGQSLLVRWRFTSDSGITGPGWFLDDIELVARQVLSVPLDVETVSGLDSAVRVTWQPPAGIDPNAPATPLEGYNVYRASTEDLSDAVLLNKAPQTPTQGAYLDETAVNGVVGYYAVTALYTDGESAPSPPAEGQAYVSQYAADLSALDVRVTDGAPVDTSIVFTNPGTGFLKINVWLGEASDTSLDQVRIRYDRTFGPLAGATPIVAPPAKGQPATTTAAARLSFAEQVAAWRTHGAADMAHVALPTASEHAKPAPQVAGGGLVLFTDAQENGPVPDLKDLIVEENANGETRFRITGWQPWGNPLTDFTCVLALNLDQDRSTGDEGGFEYFVLMGAFAISTFGVPAAIVQGQTVVAVPTHMLFPSNSDFFEVGFALEPFGNPETLILEVLAFDPALQQPRDFAPNIPTTAAWLAPQAFHVSVPTGTPGPLVLDFPAQVPPGNYAGKLFLETNAPASPAIVIPVDYHLGTTAIALEEFTAQQEDGDMVVRWRTGSESNVSAFRVHRSRDGGAFEALGPDVQPEANRDYVYRDRDVAPGPYTYRIGEVAPDGAVTLHGAVDVVMAAMAPAVSFLDPAVPNPFNPTTSLRFGVATAGPASVLVYDSRGRRVRTLLATTHLEPGFHRLTWDGLDDGGSRVASGVYHAQLLTAGRNFTRRLTLVK